MRITDCEDDESLSSRAAAIVIAAVTAKSDLLLCAATGRSPGGLYRALVEKAAADEAFFGRLRILKLDEWGGIPGTASGSCEHYLRTRLLDPLGIPSDRYMAFDATAEDPAAECERIRAELERRGPIDVCVLGLGPNGHVGFNEPAPFLIPHCHVEQLSEATRRHAMGRSMDHVPAFGLTLGMQEILASRRIVLLVTGDGKRDVTTRLLSGRVTPTLPASFLWLHGNVDCLIDRRVLGGEGAPSSA
jgi:galactosamine-6-phosphate isomerase